MFDADNDGWRDIYVCNGIYKDVIDQDFIEFFADEVVQQMALTGRKEHINEVISRMPSVPLNKAFRNGGNLKFEDKGLDWGFTTPSFSNGAAYGDLDNDGDLDLVVTVPQSSGWSLSRPRRGCSTAALWAIARKFVRNTLIRPTP